MIESLYITVVACAVALPVVYALGHKRGRAAKLKELHDLQDEGWLTITYSGDPRQPQVQAAVRGAPARVQAPAPEGDVRALLYEDPEVKEVITPRRDAEERRQDWARTLKDNQERLSELRGAKRREPQEDQDGQE